jgi:hypothetical protein
VKSFNPRSDASPRAITRDAKQAFDGARQGGVAEVRKRLNDQPAISARSPVPGGTREIASDLSKHRVKPPSTTTGRQFVPPSVARQGNAKDGNTPNYRPPQTFRSNPDGAHSGIADVRRRLGGPQSAGHDFGRGRTPIDQRAAGGVANLASRANHREMTARRLADRPKPGDFESVTKGRTAETLRLGEQYKLARQGDVARRLEVHKNVVNINKTNIHRTNITNLTNVRAGDHHHRADYYRGHVSPHYSQHAFKHHYHGPRFFAGSSWYPSWNPWVRWSWHHHCHPLWDPRPLWCRPLFYEPAPMWIYYQVPVWTPLPVVAAGTWVDVQRPVLPANETDLQLLAVRFVDPGHPEEKLGPRYRVWFRNNGSLPLTQPFNVVLVASGDGQLAPGLPQAGVRVAAVEANDIQSVDVRLPMDVYSMGRDPQGQPVPYSTVHVLVDANREVQETTQTNNGTALTVADVLPVDPAAFELEPISTTPGGEFIVAGEGFGPEPGRVLIQVAGQELDGEILGWYDLGVRVRLPNIALAGDTPADLIVIRGDSAAANPLRVTMTQPAAPVVPGLPGPVIPQLP